MNDIFNHFVKENRQLIDQRLNALFESDHDLNPDLREMMEYSVDAGGKRIRPLIMLAVLKTLGWKIGQEELTVGAALEAVHTYSLIHDDLPAMDNDDLRRGRPTSHKKFGEAEAILAGDGLLTIAFQWLVSTSFEPTIQRNLVSELALDAGPGGMVAGQLLDIQGNTRQYTLEKLRHLHELKTGKMLLFPAKAALIISDTDSDVARLIVDFFRQFGLAFQIHDDIIDVTKSSAELGKTAGKDQNLNKNTYVNLLGLADAKAELHQVLKNCQNDLDKLTRLNQGIEVEILEGFLTYLK